MNSRSKLSENTSTPKRRRLGTTRSFKESIPNSNSPIHRKVSSIITSSQRCESPPLPCNQVEYLYESGNCSIIPCSPNVFDNFTIKDEENQGISNTTIDIDNTNNILCETYSDLSNDMFNSKLEQELTQNGGITCEKHFREEIEECFDLVNQSICDIEKVDKSSLFETKDSFLLDIKESGFIPEQRGKEDLKPKTEIKNKLCDGDTFYGLPLVTKCLFKSYRNIEKFYDWQEECLNLDAIKERRNLIYALPTSGGKTLVAEVLMLNEVLNRKRNALFILPFVAIVQEKIFALSPFAVKLDFLVEEYAAGKGHIPPKKRRKKNCIYIATIEKGLGLVRSLIELDRLHEIGLIVVDELHLIGEPGRGGTLETLLTTVIFVNKGIQIVGMSATIGNLHEIADFLKAEVYQRQFRPVELVEYVKLGNMLHRIVWGEGGMELTPERELSYDYSMAGQSLDPDRLGGLVAEVVPGAACLLFCPTQRNAENVAELLCKLQRKEMLMHRAAERSSLSLALAREGAAGAARAAKAGVAWHHAGLGAEERALIENAFRSGVISVLCCTSTLAAGVNLPAQRVIIRAPFVGREFVSLGAYRQMVGRAGRAGVCDTGESIVICGAREWPQLRSVLCGGLGAARSSLLSSAHSLLLSGVALRLADTRAKARRLLATTLLAKSSDTDIDAVCDETLQSLVQSGALELTSDRDSSKSSLSDNSQLAVSELGKAAIKGGLEIAVAKQLLLDLEMASRCIVLMGGLHLLYLVTPHEAAVRPDYRHYYALYDELDEEGVRTARILGITEVNAVRMMTGKPITNVSEKVLCRFYLALMLRDLWRQMPVHAVAQKYCVSRGIVQGVLSSSAALAQSAARLAQALPQQWAFAALLAELAPRLRHCAAPELHQLMELPRVKKARAMQLLLAGFKRVEDVARAAPAQLVSQLDHLSLSAASHLISAARMLLIEKVENLRAEAEDVMEELNI